MHPSMSCVVVDKGHVRRMHRTFSQSAVSPETKEHRHAQTAITAGLELAFVIYFKIKLLNVKLPI